MKWTKIIKKIEEQIEAGIYPGASFAYFKDNQVGGQAVLGRQ